MMARAVVLGANAVVGVRCEVAPHGLPAVVAYGTAVRVEVVA
jgi:uncharacterized protein YbjQ (UPF0145 family)